MARLVDAEVQLAGDEGTICVNLRDRAIDYRLQLAGVLHFSSFGQNLASFVGSEPGGIAHRLEGISRLFDFQEEGFDHEFLNTGWLPEDSLGVDVDVKMPGLDSAPDPSFFQGLALGGLTVREVRFGRPLGKGPLAVAIGADQQELYGRTLAAIAYGGYLQRQCEP